MEENPKLCSAFNRLTIQPTAECRNFKRTLEGFAVPPRTSCRRCNRVRTRKWDRVPRVSTRSRLSAYVYIFQYLYINVAGM